MSAALAGKHAFVTGGGRGIGAAVARALAGEGARLTLFSRDGALLEKFGETLRAQTDVHTIAGDVTSDADVAAAFKRATAALGNVDILINNAGGTVAKPFAAMDRATWDATLALNLGGTYACSRAAIGPMLAAGWGRIVNVASTAGLGGARYITAYCAAKHAVVGLTRALAVEVAGGGVTVNAVCPGFVDTDLMDGAIANVMQATGREAAAAREALLAQGRQTRVVTPEEVAHAVAWLCAPASGAITGQAVVIDASGSVT